MSDRVYGQDEKAKLERLVNEGAQVLQEIQDLQEGLKETVKACLLYTSPSPRD